jgi:hypothetical protein
MNQSFHILVVMIYLKYKCVSKPIYHKAKAHASAAWRVKRVDIISNNVELMEYQKLKSMKTTIGAIEYRAVFSTVLVPE